LRVEVRVGIDERGDVLFVDAVSSGAPSTLLRCIERTLSSLTFPRLDVPLGVAETTLRLDVPET